MSQYGTSKSESHRIHYPEYIYVLQFQLKYYNATMDTILYFEQFMRWWWTKPENLYTCVSQEWMQLTKFSFQVQKSLHTAILLPHMPSYAGPSPPCGVTQLMFCDGHLISQVLQWMQFCALICKRLPPDSVSTYSYTPVKHIIEVNYDIKWKIFLPNLQGRIAAQVHHR
jgi:hypothetical protein